MFNIVNNLFQSIFGFALAGQQKPPVIIPPYQVQGQIPEITTNEKVKIWLRVNGIYLVIGFFLHLQFISHIKF